MNRRSFTSFLPALIAIGALALVVYALLIRNAYYTSAEQTREAYSEWPPNKTLTIGVVWPERAEPGLMEGVQLALGELNASDSPLANKIVLRRYTEELGDTGEVARRIASDSDLVAVIGHEVAESAIPSSITYENHAIVFLSPTVSLKRLTTHLFNYTFQLVPEDHDFTQALTQYAIHRDWRRVGVLYGRIEHGEFASRLFAREMLAAGLHVPFFRSYNEQADWRKEDFRSLIAGVMPIPVDAVMLADELPWGAVLLRDMRKMGMHVPVLATNPTDSVDLWPLAQTAANNVFVASVVEEDSQHPPFATFRERFNRKFGSNPGYRASQGYEAFWLFVHAAERSSSVDPLLVATTLKTNTWDGLFGPYSFASNGSIQGRDVIIKQMQDGQFKAVQVFKVDP
jgi:branched-chain amino acid transport system substrate-binding protein